MAKTPSPSRLLADVADEGAARSKLGRWMTRHHDEMASVVASGINWARTTQALVEAGLVKAGTKPSVVKRAWDRVQVRVAATRAKRQPARHTEVAKAPYGYGGGGGGEHSSGFKPFGPAIPVKRADPTPEPSEPKFRPATPRGMPAKPKDKG